MLSTQFVIGGAPREVPAPLTHPPDCVLDGRNRQVWERGLVTVQQGFPPGQQLNQHLRERRRALASIYRTPTPRYTATAALHRTFKHVQGSRIIGTLARGRTQVHTVPVDGEVDGEED